MGIRAFVFDMDGTILDSLPDLTVVTNKALEQMGYPTHTQDQVLTYVGNGAERLVAQAVPDYATDAEKAQMLTLWQSLYPVYGEKLTVEFPGMSDTLRELRRRGVKTAVLSNKFDAAVVSLAQRYFPGLFDIARGEIPPTPRKPDPTALLQILDQLGVEPNQAAYVGDTAVDYQVARNAGVMAVGVSWGYDAALPLPVRQLDAYVHTPAQLIGLLD